jgi:hypothetical protein
MVTKSFVGVVVMLWGATLWAHPKGIHERIVVTVGPKQIEVLMTLDADSGAPGQLLRMGADRNGDGKLDREETEGLKKLTSRRMRDALSANLSGYPLRFEEVSTKMDLRQSERRDEEGLSSAVLLKALLPEPPSDGMELSLQHRGTGATHVVATVFVGDPSRDGGATVQESDLAPGVPFKVRISGLR